MRPLAVAFLVAGLSMSLAASAEGQAETDLYLGLPPVLRPDDNAPTGEKIALGRTLFFEARFSASGKVSCSTCHLPGRAFTDSPLRVSEGINQLRGTRNAPSILNAAYFEAFFWDGRSPSLEDQALHPFVNPVEMGLETHESILQVVRTDPAYVAAFDKAFGKTGEEITMAEVTHAIAAFERTQVAGGSPFDRWYFGGEQQALSESQKRGYDLFIGRGRCVSCHRIEQTQALFTDNRFHNLGVGINRIQGEVPAIAAEFLEAKATLSEVDKAVLTDVRTSELGRFVVTKTLDDIGSFKTPTLRNVAVTAPYMHDGSLGTLRDVLMHYNLGGISKEYDPVNDFLSSGIRPLGLNDQEIDDLVGFMEALTSPPFAPRRVASGRK